MEPDAHILPPRDALNDAGAVQKVLGPPSDAPRILIDWIDTPLGPMLAATDRTHLHLLEFTDRKALPNALRKLSAMVKGQIGFGHTTITDETADALGRYFAGSADDFNVPLALHGTPFTRAVWQALQDMPAGETCTYGALALAVDRPDAVRAVARANGANQIAILIPCHRIVAGNGDLTGYGGGLWRKRRLIDHERNMQRSAL